MLAKSDRALQGRHLLYAGVGRSWPVDRWLVGAAVAEIETSRQRLEGGDASRTPTDMIRFTNPP